MFSDYLLTRYKISSRLGAMTETRKKLAMLACLFTIVLARVFLGEPVPPRRAMAAGAAIGGALVVLLARA